MGVRHLECQLHTTISQRRPRRVMGHTLRNMAKQLLPSNTLEEHLSNNMAKHQCNRRRGTFTRASQNTSLSKGFLKTWNSNLSQLQIQRIQTRPVMVAPKQHLSTSWVYILTKEIQNSKRIWNKSILYNRGFISYWAMRNALFWP